MVEITTILIIIGVSCVVIGLGITWAIRTQRNRSIEGEVPYRWQPEQDYDVEIHGESAMQPGFPVLKPRKRASGKDNANDVD